MATINNSGTGNINFYTTAKGGSAMITNTGAGNINVQGSADLENATVTLTNGSLDVFGGATAGTSTLNLGGTGNHFFSGTSNAGSAIITHNGTGSLVFTDNATANGATIQTTAANILVFQLNARAGTANITNGATANLLFANDSSAQGASIINNGQMGFQNDASAGASMITNNNILNFQNDANAGTSTITNNSDLFLDGNSQATNAKLNNAMLGSQTFLRFRSTPLALGSLTGTGKVSASFGNATLSVGHLNLNETFDGNFEDGPGPDLLSVTKEGTGTFTLTGLGHNFSGDLTINQGNLVWDGSVVNPGPENVLVGPMGTLSGTGALTKAVSNDGIVSPGNAAMPFGKLNTGSYSGLGTLRININPTQNSSLGASTVADLQNTTLNLNVAEARYANCPSFVIVSAGVSVNNTFANVTGLPARLTAQLIYATDETTLIIKEVPFTEILRNLSSIRGNNQDQMNLAAALDDPNTDPDFNAVIAFINMFTPEQIANALDQLGSDHFNTLPVGDFYATQLVNDIFSDGFESGDVSAWSTTLPYRTSYRDSVSARILAKRPQNLVANFCQSSPKKDFHEVALDLKDRLGVHGRDHVRSYISNNPGTGYVWVQGFGGYLDAQKTFEDIGFRANTAGVMLGTDYQVRDNLRIGVGGGYAQSKLDQTRKLGKAEIKSPFGSLWGHYLYHAAEFDFGLTYRRNTYDNKRFITFLPARRTANGKHNGYNILPFVQAGYNFAVNDCVDLKPFVGLDYFFTHEDAFTETNASGLNLRVKKRDASILQSKIGVALDQRIAWSSGFSKHGIAASYKTRKASNNPTTTASFVGGSTAFLSAREDKRLHRFGVKGNAGFFWNNGTNVNVSYFGDFGRGQVSHTAMLSLGKSF